MHTFDSWLQQPDKTGMRKSRISRSRNNGKHQVTPHLLELLELLGRYKYLRTNHIIELLPHRSQDGLRRSLRRAFDHGYLDRPKERLRGYNSLYCCEIYTLDSKGERLLIDRGIVTEQATRLYRDKSDAPHKQFAHAMMICDTLASIEAGAKAAGVRFIPWTEIVQNSPADKPLKLPAHFHHQFGSHTESFDSFMVPDGLFGLEYQDGKKAYFALEAEHYNPIKPTTLKRASTLKKFVGYRDIVRSGVYKDQLGIGNMRVLVVAPTPARSMHQVECLAELVGTSHLFLFHPVPVQEEMLKSPPPFPELFSATWARAGLPGEQINAPSIRDPKAAQ